MGRSRVIIGLTVAVLFSISLGCIPLSCAATPAARLRPAMTVGTTMQYRVIARYEASDTLALPKSNLDLDATYRQRVVETDKDGTIVLELRPIKGRLRTLDGEHPEPDTVLDPKQAPTFTARTTASGGLVEFPGLLHETSAIGIWGATMDPVPLYPWFTGLSGFPDHEVKAGDSWGTRVAVDFAEMGKHEVHSTSKLCRFESVGERQCAVIESEVTLPVASMTGEFFRRTDVPIRPKGDMTIKTTSLVDVTDGKLIRSEGSFVSKVNYTIHYKGESGTEESVSAVSEVRGTIRVTMEPVD